MILYGTLGCHLCDEAKEIVMPIFKANNISYEEIDIAHSDELVARYGVRIPVIKSDITGNELGWPFDAPLFIAWLQEN